MLENFEKTTKEKCSMASNKFFSKLFRSRDSNNAIDYSKNNNAIDTIISKYQLSSSFFDNYFMIL